MVKGDGVVGGHDGFAEFALAFPGVYSGVSGDGAGAVG